MTGGDGGESISSNLRLFVVLLWGILEMMLLSVSCRRRRARESELFIFDGELWFRAPRRLPPPRTQRTQDPKTPRSHLTPLGFPTTRGRHRGPV
jgi:hypothetical protein